MNERNVKKVHSFVDMKQMLDVMGLDGCNEQGLKHEIENNQKLKDFVEIDGDSEEHPNNIKVSKKISINNNLLSNLTDKATNIDSKKNKVI